MSYSLYRIVYFIPIRKTTHPESFGLASLERLNLRRIQRHGTFCVWAKHSQRHDIIQHSNITTSQSGTAPHHTHAHSFHLKIKTSASGLKNQNDTNACACMEFGKALPWALQRRCWKTEEGSKPLQHSQCNDAKQSGHSQTRAKLLLTTSLF